ncbi:MAG: response regulator transcription factor [bacterium]|nr:response regulator transcription factor [bacterium]
MSEKKIYSVFIAEDMRHARELLIDYLATREELKLEGTAKNGEEALEKLTSGNYDLLLLDINLPIMSGIEVLEKMDNIPYVIFTTAYDKYAIKAFDFGAVDYLLKPFPLERFNQAVDRFLEAKRESQEKQLSFKDFSLSFRENRIQCLVAFKDIIYLSSHGKRTVIHTEEKDFEASSILKDIEEKLAADDFVRIHKQYIVNTKHITRIQHDVGGQYVAVFNDSDESTLPVGRTYVSTLKERLELD